MRNSYVIITSVYNEALFIKRTLDSVIKQSILPVEWIIVDDGSTDGTQDIIKSYSENNPFIKVVASEKSTVGFGAHVAYNFNIGLQHIKDNEYHFIVKLDGDLDIDSDRFFELQIERFSETKKLGISSGITYSIQNDKKVLTSSRPYWRTGGAMKMYKKDCFKDIGGIQPIYGWDGLDEYLAMYYGWKTRTFFDLHVNHLGKKRAVDRDKKLKMYSEKGKSFFVRGYPFEFLILKVVKLSLKNILFGEALYKGYAGSKRKGIKQCVDRDQKCFIRRVQYLRILDKFTSRQLL